MLIRCWLILRQAFHWLSFSYWVKWVFFTLNLFWMTLNAVISAETLFVFFCQSFGLMHCFALILLSSVVSVVMWVKCDHFVDDWNEWYWRLSWQHVAQYYSIKVKVNVKSGTWYSAVCMSQTRDRDHFTFSEVAAHWLEVKIPQCIM